MTKMIYKYPLGDDIHHNAVYEIEMPRGAKILTIQAQGNFPVIWAIVNPKREKRKYVFHVFGTGFEMYDYEKKHYDYVATVQRRNMMGSIHVWHVFEVHE
jgi:hypothetical protein